MYCGYSTFLCLFLLTGFQPPLLISSDDIHHALIGTFQPSASAISDIENSCYSHSWACMHSLCLTASTRWWWGFGEGIFSIQVFWHPWHGQKPIFWASFSIFSSWHYRVYPQVSSLMIIFCMVSFSISCFIPILWVSSGVILSRVSIRLPLFMPCHCRSRKWDNVFVSAELVSEIEVFQVYGKASDRWWYLHLPSRCDSGIKAGIIWPVKEALSIDCWLSLPLNRRGNNVCQWSLLAWWWVPTLQLESITYEFKARDHI